MVSRAVANKRTGALFEGDIRQALRQLGQFIYTKGVSSKGIDIFALKDNNAIQLELKSHKKITNPIRKEALSQFIANDVIVTDFINCTQYTPSNVLYSLIMYERNNHITTYHTNGYNNYYKKNKAIRKELLDILNTEIELFFKEN